jgi:hypothetical protein
MKRFCLCAAAALLIAFSGFGYGVEYQKSRVSLTLVDGGVFKNAVLTGITINVTGSDVTVENITSLDASGPAFNIP